MSIAALYEPQIPGIRDVLAPGLRVRGATWSTDDPNDETGTNSTPPAVSGERGGPGPDGILAGDITIPTLG